MDSELSVISLI